LPNQHKPIAIPLWGGQSSCYSPSDLESLKIFSNHIFNLRIYYQNPTFSYQDPQNPMDDIDFEEINFSIQLDNYE
jgi:hypothetical protein